VLLRHRLQLRRAQMLLLLLSGEVATELSLLGRDVAGEVGGAWATTG
jgi:hypothetical protein